ncbi:MAG: hypothetical protein ACR2OZ_08795 [Verrucomicrobiales bacterium]
MKCAIVLFVGAVAVLLLVSSLRGPLFDKKGQNPAPLAKTLPPVPPEPLRVGTNKHSTTKEAAALDKAGPLDPEKAEEEAHKEMDRQNLRKLHAGIFAYRKKHGHFPEFLSQLVPEFISAEALVSPRPKEKRGQHAYLLKRDHEDPSLSEASYGFEFSNLVFRDDRTFAEIKEVQRAEWGDTVPILRCFNYDKVINMAYGGEIFETQLDWEYDPATLDVVDKYGWGPGLKEGEFVKVRVTNSDGTPLPNADVWAGGRTYSFALPDRPFPTDGEGYASIPLGVDVDRTALQLRLSAPGLAAPVVAFESGQVPDSPTLVAEPAQTIGGQLLADNGAPLPGTRLVLKRSADAGGSGTVVSYIKTDAQGQWQAAIHPNDLQGLSAVVALPGSQPSHQSGQPLDPAAAIRGEAVVHQSGGG